MKAKNPSDNSTLIELAVELGLDKKRFASDLVAPETQAELAGEINRCGALGLNSFPSLALLEEGQVTRIRHDYNDAQVILDQLV